MGDMKNFVMIMLCCLCFVHIHVGSHDYCDDNIFGPKIYIWPHVNFISFACKIDIYPVLLIIILHLKSHFVKKHMCINHHKLRQINRSSM